MTAAFEGYVVRFSLTSRCQMKCSFCSPTTAKDLDFSEICEIVSACAHAGIRVVHWTGGEPTLRRDFVEIVRHAKGVGIEYQTPVRS